MIPTYDKFIDPVLRLLEGNPGGVAAAAAYEAAANALGLTEEQKLRVLDSGAQIYKNRAAWAHDRLKRAGLSSSPRRGVWQLTEAGRSYAADHPFPLDDEEVGRIATGYLAVKLRSAVDAAALDGPASSELVPGSPVLSPDDRLDSALAELKSATAVELLDCLLRVSPGRFEIIVLDILHRLGYGASRSDLLRVGGAGDGGIDGVISLDKLGLDKVYVQAKRWKSTVGRPELQAFYGALAGQKAKRGVFITTSGFTPQAVDFVGSVEGIVIVDGNRLVGLMIDNEVGVSSRILRVPSVDSDYFDEDA
ncbi:restriction endonuclease [Stenotrophomonas sp.]|uniref:restriction endonuclease n=1 Tax=Stenotrophomonas sp. TaxID=69392 RepID=UPI0028B208D7|nr:restriction endonuclease [Stenotrophomonas sp.]